jgi:cytochrome c553
MPEFRSGETKATVMGRIAQGLSDDEMQAIVGWPPAVE